MSKTGGVFEDSTSSDGLERNGLGEVVVAYQTVDLFARVQSPVQPLKKMLRWLSGQRRRAANPWAPTGPRRFESGPQRYATVAEWFKATVSKTVPLGACRFKSCPWRIAEVTEWLKVPSWKDGGAFRPRRFDSCSLRPVRERAAQQAPRDACGVEIPLAWRGSTPPSGFCHGG